MKTENKVKFKLGSVNMKTIYLTRHDASNIKSSVF